MAPEHANGLDDGELPVDTVTAVETRLQRLKRIALFSARLLAAPSASDETSGTMGTMWTRTDGRRSARLTSTTETGDDDDTVVDGGTAQCTVEGPLTWAAATGATGEETGISGRPMMCINHASRGRASFTQKNYPTYCCDVCAISGGTEHTDNCGYRPAPEAESHVPGSAAMESMLNDTTPKKMDF